MHGVKLATLAPVAASTSLIDELAIAEKSGCPRPPVAICESKLYQLSPPFASCVTRKYVALAVSEIGLESEVQANWPGVMPVVLTVTDPPDTSVPPELTSLTICACELP